MHKSRRMLVNIFAMAFPGCRELVIDIHLDAGVRPGKPTVIGWGKMAEALDTELVNAMSTNTLSSGG